MARIGTRSVALALTLFAASAFLAPQAAGAQAAPKPPERAVRRDIPLTNMIRRAFDAGTRDSTGRPGRNYWQLWMDYTINARLEPTTSTITGRETAVIHNQSDSAMRTIVHAARPEHLLAQRSARRGGHARSPTA